MFYFKLLATDNLPFSLSNTSTSTARPYLSILPLTVLAIVFLLFSYLSPIIYVYTMRFVRSTIKLLHVLITVSFSNARLSNFQNVNFFILTVNYNTFTQISTDKFNNLNSVHSPTEDNLLLSSIYYTKPSTFFHYSSTFFIVVFCRTMSNCVELLSSLFPYLKYYP